MKFALVLLCSICVIVVFRNGIKRHPRVLYMCVAAINVLYGLGLVFDLGAFEDVMVYLMRKCMLAVAFFCVVMYVGVLPQESSARKWLQPIRGEISIAGCILACGHILTYTYVYLPLLSAGFLSVFLLASFFAALILSILLLILGITSIKAVRRRLTVDRWRRIQITAYLFYLLVCIHVLCTFFGSAMAGGTVAQETILIYATVFGLYGVLKLSKTLCVSKRRGLRQYKCSEL